MGHTYTEIANFLKCTERQAQYANNEESATPKKRSGRPPLLTDEQVTELIQYISSSRERRRMTSLTLAIGPFAHFKVSQEAIQAALENHGYGRYPALQKPFRSFGPVKA